MLPCSTREMFSREKDKILFNYLFIAFICLFNADSSYFGEIKSPNKEGHLKRASFLRIRASFKLISVS